MPQRASAFLQKLRSTLDDRSLVKATLSDPAHGDTRNVYLRRVQLREGERLSFLHRLPTRDITKNLPPDEGLAQVALLLESQFQRAHLFTTTGDFLWLHSRPEKLKASRPTFHVPPPPDHDRTTQHPVNPGAPYLQALRITNASGEPRPAMADKLRQIQRFVELLGHLVDDSPLASAGTVRLLDAGSGRGSLTFAACDFFQKRGIQVTATGIEQRAELVEFTNQAAQSCGFQGLTFTQGRIEDAPAQPGSLDVLMALHACDTATDDALFHAITAGATLIVAAPCCHQEVRRQLHIPALLDPVCKHGILLERQAETLTDALRALLLEIHGYKASVFEFISPEHTAKNLMIAAVKRTHPTDPAPLRAQLAALRSFYGLTQQRLAQRLGEFATENPAS